MEAWEWVTTIIILYSLIVVGLGYVAYRRFRHTIEDFFLLSRRVGFIVLFLTLAATYHSAFAFLTSVAVFSKSGISFWVAAAVWTPLAAVSGYVLGRRFHLLGKARGHITPADLLADFYGSEALRYLTALLLATFVIAYMVVQSLGLGIVLSVGSGGHVSLTWASFFFLAVTIIYLVVGGNRAAFWTDALQGVWMYIGVWAAGLFVVYKFFPGGVGELMDSVREVNPKLLTMNWPIELATSFIIVYSVGVILLPHMWLRYYSARDKTTLRLSTAGMALYVSSYYIPAALIGLAAAVFNAHGLVVGGKELLEPGFIDSLTKTYGSRDAVMAYMIYTLTPAVFAGFLLAGAASAAMSTLDSLLGATSMILTRDIYQRLKKTASESELVTVGRIWIVLWGLIAWYFTVQKPGLIFDLVAVSASGGLQFLIPALQAVFPTKKNIITKQGAIWGVIAGILVNILLCNKFPFYKALGVTGYHAAIAGVIGLIINAIVALIVSLFTKPVSEEKIEEYRKILAEE